jgi:hypothetical protein
MLMKDPDARLREVATRYYVRFARSPNFDGMDLFVSMYLTRTYRIANDLFREVNLMENKTRRGVQEAKERIKRRYPTPGEMLMATERGEDLLP